MLIWLGQTDLKISMKLISVVNDILKQTDGELITVPKHDIKTWVQENAPLAPNAYKSSGWDLADLNTWYSMAFFTHVVEIYSKRIAFHFTISLTHYDDCKKFLRSKFGDSLRQEFGFDYHSNILLSAPDLFKPEDIYAFWEARDDVARYNSLDYSIGNGND